MDSSFFWEERNVWFSDVWEIKGTKQNLQKSNTRERSAAFPFEVPYRLINMFSQKGDTILDPFLGTGTTMQAAILTGRNSCGYDIDANFEAIIREGVEELDLDLQVMYSTYIPVCWSVLQSFLMLWARVLSPHCQLSRLWPATYQHIFQPT